MNRPGTFLFLSTLVALSGCGGAGGAAGETDTDGEAGTTTLAGTTVGPDDGSTTTTGDPMTEDSSGSSGTPSDLPVPNEPPTAVVSLLPASGVAPLDVQFDGSMSSDPDGTIVGFDWDAGDGTTENGENVTHTFTTAGCFEVALTVTDDDGATDTASDTVVVVDAVAKGVPDATIEVAPLASAVLPRNLETNEGLAHFEGTVNSVGYAFAQAEVLSGETVVSTTLVPLCGAAPITFVLDAPIPAELVSHDVRISLVVGDVAAEIGLVPDLVAGDLYVIQGQSNAVSGQFNGDANAENQGPFIRSFGTNSTDGGASAADTVWRMANGNTGGGVAGIGQWPMRMAAVLSAEQAVPLGLVNGALGGQPIGYFQRNDANPLDPATNYGRLLARLQAAGIDQDIRAFLWYQGESDGADALGHQTGFVALYEDWLEDYGDLERTYVTQIRAGCGGNVIGTQEVQRAFADEYDAISVMSTTALNGHDGCHYAFEDGYKILGERYAGLLARDLYGVMPQSDVDAPNPDTAAFASGGTEVVIAMRNTASVLSYEEGAHTDFRLENAPGITVMGGAVAGHELTLTLSGDGTAATGITYLGRQGAGQWVTNENGIGLLTFLELPIEAE